jgi:hypothetical protein
VENQIVKVGFYGGDLEAIKQGEDVYVSVRRACEHLGIDAEGQRQKLTNKDRTPWARTFVIKAHDINGRLQDSFMIHIDGLPMWMATIDASRCSNESK